MALYNKFLTSNNVVVFTTPVDPRGQLANLSESLAALIQGPAIAWRTFVHRSPSKSLRAVSDIGRSAVPSKILSDRGRAVEHIELNGQRALDDLTVEDHAPFQ